MYNRIFATSERLSDLQVVLNFQLKTRTEDALALKKKTWKRAGGNPLPTRQLTHACLTKTKQASFVSKCWGQQFGTVQYSTT